MLDGPGGRSRWTKQHILGYVGNVYLINHSTMVSVECLSEVMLRLLECPFNKLTYTPSKIMGN